MVAWPANFSVAALKASDGGYGDESNMLTGDLNAAVVEWVVQYRIVDPYKYLFRVRNVGETFRDMSEAVMRQVVGDRTVNEVLTVGRAEVALRGAASSCRNSATSTRPASRSSRSCCRTSIRPTR